MQFTAIILLAACLQVSAFSYAQQISISGKNISLQKVFKEIGRQTGYDFIYANEELQRASTVTLNLKNASLRDVLDICFDHQPLTYRINQKIIVVSAKTASPSMQEQASVQLAEIRGEVRDSVTGKPLPGVSIQVRGSNTGTVTDEGGRFSLSVPGNVVLVASYLGYNKKEVTISGSSLFIEITLAPSATGLNQIVVVGYGTQKKSDVTGSVSVVPMSKLNDMPVTSVSQALVGVSPGVQVNQISGEPGSAPQIRVRGVGSITAGNEPLFVIDGFPTEGNDLSNFNVDDIASISILKDASATSIYGSRGSNGVVLITTKRGEEGTPKVSLAASMGLSQLTHKLDVLSPQEYVQFALDAVNNAWAYLGNDPNSPLDTRPTFYQVPPYFLDPDSWVLTDWQDEVYRTATDRNYQLSVNGGTKNIRYRVSGGYYDQDGIIKASNFKRYSLNVNVDNNITDKLTLSLGLNTSKIHTKKVESTGQWNNGVVATALSLPGFYGTINKDGSYPAHSGMGYNTSAVWNPMIFLNEYHHPVDETRILGNISLKYDILKGLYFNTLFGFDNQDVNDNEFINNIVFDVPASTTFQRNTVEGSGSHSSVSSFNWLSENTLHYDADFNDHHVSALLGFTAQKASTDNSDIGANNFPNNLVRTLNAGQVTSGSTTKSEWSMLSLLSRVNYTYKNKYLATLTLRRDGSSRFGGQNRWGYFPSVSAGWVVSEEGFFKNTVVNYLKIKTSYGVSGNNAIPNYGSIGLLSYANYVLGNDIIGGQVPSTLSNENLGWERSKQFNAGIESGFLGDRIMLNAEVYQSINDNLLLNVPVPSITGVTSALQNIGKVRNRGLELNLTTRNITGNFSWTTEFNVSFNRNIVKELGPSGTPILASTYQYQTNITQIGRPIGDFYGYVFEGVYNTQDQIDHHPHLSTDRPGDPIVKDVSGDGKITVDDRTILGNYQPDYYFALDNTFRYKGFDLRVFLQGVEGADIMDLDYYQSMSMTGRTNSLGLARERWRSPDEPGNGKVFNASIDIRGNRRMPSSFYIQDASYIRVKNITLGYNFSPSTLKKLSISNARVYLSTQDPFTFTDYVGYNPEISSYPNSALTPGVNYYGYPLQKTLTLGVNLTF